MNNSSQIARIVRRATLLALGGVAFLTVGCGTQPPSQELTLRCLSQGQSFTQQFSRAFVMRNAEGDTELVLADRPAIDAAQGGHFDAPVRQIMHIQVKWHPKRDQKSDHNSASNATVHWYVLGNTPQNSGDILEYSGTAFVSVDDSGDLSELTIRNGSVAPVARRGDLRDPVGPSQLQGSVKASWDRARVRELLGSVRSVVAMNTPFPSKVTSATPELPSSAAR